MKAKLCKCNNCDLIMFDENPSDQAEFAAPKGTASMVQLEDTQEGDLERSFFWACPTCLTDDYLVDVTSVHQLPDSDSEEPNPHCKKYPDSEALPDEDDKCSLCGGGCVD
jgi:hypothetical protein